MTVSIDSRRFQALLKLAAPSGILARSALVGDEDIFGAWVGKPGFDVGEDVGTTGGTTKNHGHLWDLLGGDWNMTGLCSHDYWEFHHPS